MTTLRIRTLVPALALGLLASAPALAAPARADSSKAAAAPRPASPASKPAAEPPVAVAKGRLYAVLLGPGAKWKKGQPFKGPGLDQHRAYWKKLYGEGRVASAGPLGEDIGLVLLRARSQSDANAILKADPAVSAQILRGVARPYSAAMTSSAVLAGR